MMTQYNEELLGLLSYFTAEKYKILHSVSRCNYIYIFSYICYLTITNPSSKMSVVS